MKRLLIVILMLVGSKAMAGEGCAPIEHWYKASKSYTHIWITNLSEHKVEVEVIFWGKNGDEVKPTNHTNLEENRYLNPGATGYVTVGKGSTDWGHGEVSWKNLEGEHDDVAIRAWGFRHNGASSAESGIGLRVNEGQPF